MRTSTSPGVAGDDGKMPMQAKQGKGDVPDWSGVDGSAEFAETRDAGECGSGLWTTRPWTTWEPSTGAEDGDELDGAGGYERVLAELAERASTRRASLYVHRAVRHLNEDYVHGNHPPGGGKTTRGERGDERGVGRRQQEADRVLRRAGEAAQAHAEAAARHRYCCGTVVGAWEASEVEGGRASDDDRRTEADPAMARGGAGSRWA